jgi:hypothetical protein
VSSPLETTLQALVESAFARPNNEELTDPRIFSKELRLKLAAVLRGAGVSRLELRAFALTLRDLADQPPFSPAAPLTAEQQAGLLALSSAPRVSPNLLVVLRAAERKIRHRRDLYDLVGLLLSTWEMSALVQATNLGPG